MPYLRIQTNRAVDDKVRQSLLKSASQLVARELAKPEEYVMVSFESVSAMLFAGSAEPAAFLELRAIGLPVERAGDLSRLLAELVATALGIPGDRLFINFADVPPHLWGWNGETF